MDTCPKEKSEGVTPKDLHVQKQDCHDLKPPSQESCPCIYKVMRSLSARLHLIQLTSHFQVRASHRLSGKLTCHVCIRKSLHP